MKKNKNFFWLEKWFSMNSNSSIFIKTIDNPGWKVTIDIGSTKINNKLFSTIDIDKNENDWFNCWLENNYFEGRGGEKNLQDIIHAFTEWSDVWKNVEFDRNHIDSVSIERIQNWYINNCNKDWEHSYGVEIKSYNNFKGWMMICDLKDTTLMKKNFETVFFRRSNEDWISCKKNEDKFEVICGILNLDEAVELFCNWAES